MRFYLKYLNPAVALTVLAVCIWAAIRGGTFGSESSFEIFGIVAGGFPSYFFAKGLFCSSALFISGMTLLEILNRSDASKPMAYGYRGAFIVAVFTMLFIGGLGGAFVWKFKEELKPEARMLRMENPKGIELGKVAWIKESEKLMLSLRIKNNTAKELDTVFVAAKVFIGDRFAEEFKESCTNIKPGEEGFLSMKSFSILTASITDSLSCQTVIETNCANK